MAVALATVHTPPSGLRYSSPVDSRTVSSPPHPVQAAVDRRRYRRVRTFFVRALLHAVWWDYILNRPVLRRFRTPPLQRWRRIARRYRVLAEELGGVLIKLGQFLSARVDVLPIAITRELATLQDEVPAAPFAAIRRVLEEGLGAPCEERFAHLEERPLGAASLAQVYAARLSTGEEVAVKVQRPGIERLVETDLAAISRTLRWLRYATPIRRRVDVDWLLKEFTSVTRHELDFEREASNAEHFARDFADDPGVRVPRVYRSHTCRTVLTLENVAAIKVCDLAALEAAGISRAAVAKKLYGVFMRQFFVTHFVHADPHPGNVFVHPCPAASGALETGSTPFQLAFVDFGMMTTIPERLRQGLKEFAIGLGTRDARRIVDAYVTAGTLLPEADLERLVEAHEAILARFWGVRIAELKEVAFAEARHLANEYRDLLFEAPIQVQADMLFALRAVGILAGLCTALDPEFDPWRETLPFAERLLRDDSRQGVIEELGEVARALMRAPAQLDRLLAHVERGGMAVRSSFSPDARERLQRLERSLDRLAWFVAASGLLVAGAVLRDNGSDPRLSTCLLLASAASLVIGLLRR